MSFPSTIRSLVRRTSIAFFTNGPRSARARSPGAGSDPHGEMTNVVAGKLVGLQLNGPGDPSTLGRRRSHDDFLVRRRRSARERSPLDRDPIGRRVARQKARRDRAARRPANRPSFGERHRAIDRRRERRHVEQQLRVREGRRALPLAALTVGEQRDLSRVEARCAHDARRPAERERRDRPLRRSVPGGRSLRGAGSPCRRERVRRCPTSQTRSVDVAAETTSRAIVLNWSSSGRPLMTADELSELSITIAIAVGAWPAPSHRATGRAAAAAIASSASTRSSINKRFRIGSVRLCSFSARSR